MEAHLSSQEEDSSDFDRCCVVISVDLLNGKRLSGLFGETSSDASSSAGAPSRSAAPGRVGFRGAQRRRRPLPSSRGEARGEPRSLVLPAAARPHGTRGAGRGRRRGGRDVTSSAGAEGTRDGQPDGRAERAVSGLERRPLPPAPRPPPPPEGAGPRGQEGGGGLGPAEAAAEGAGRAESPRADTTISRGGLPRPPRRPEIQTESPEAATAAAAETPFMAILLAATRIAQPLARLALNTPHCKDGAATSLRLLPKVQAAASAWRSQRCYATEVEEISERPVLITGCDSGFGFSLAKFLHEKGFIIYAGCLLKEQGRGGSKDLDNMKSDRMRTVQLNVCDSEEVGRAVDHVTSTLKDPETGGLWGLVNNAGISTFGEVEFTSMDTYKEVAEVNLWGTIRTTKAFLPLIRRAKGRVVNISSMMGRMANPARSPYCITKFGVEAFSDCLRYEMRPHDVKVCIVEPGNFIAGTSLYSPERIQSIADKMWDELPEIVRRDYGRKYFDEQIAKMESYCSSGSSDTSPVVESIGHALTSTTPYTRYHPMDYYWWLRMQVMTHMPAAISDRLYIY